MLWTAWEVWDSVPTMDVGNEAHVRQWVNIRSCCKNCQMRLTSGHFKDTEKKGGISSGESHRGAGTNERGVYDETSNDER